VSLPKLKLDLTFRVYLVNPLKLQLYIELASVAARSYRRQFVSPALEVMITRVLQFINLLSVTPLPLATIISDKLIEGTKDKYENIKQQYKVTLDASRVNGCPSIHKSRKISVFWGVSEPGVG